MEEAWDRIGQPVSSSGACVPIIKAHEGDELNQPNHRLVVLDTMTLDRLTCPTITPSGRVTKGRPGQARPCQPTTDPTGTGLGSLALWPRAAGKLPADLYLTANNGPGPMNHGCSIELLLRLVDTATTVVIPLHWRAIVPGECCYLLRGRHDTRPRLFLRCCDNEEGEGPGTVTVPRLLILPVPCFMSYYGNIK